MGEYARTKMISLENIPASKLEEKMFNAALDEYKTQQKNIEHELDVKRKIESVLQSLNYREREIIKLRYGIPTGCNYTLEEVGKLFHVTRERVRQIEAKAMKKLYHPTRSTKLAEFIEMCRK